MSTLAELSLITILLVEDNPGDVRLVRDGEQAIDYLRKRGNYEDAPQPDLILLDLNLPKKNGAEVLEDIKTDADLHSIPVIILTASKAEEDIARAYDHYANCYLTKPIDLNQFISVVQQIKTFWLSIVQLPGARAHD
jgi:chemotaxis family two-component system response regulator Rcp1